MKLKPVTALSRRLFFAQDWNQLGDALHFWIVGVTILPFHEIGGEQAKYRTIQRWIHEQRVGDGAVAGGARDLAQDFFWRRRISSEPDIETRDGARSMIEVAQNLRRRIAMRGECLKEIIRIRFCPIHSRQSFAGGIWISHCLEGDAEVVRVGE